LDEHKGLLHKGMMGRQARRNVKSQKRRTPI
jgi:hypothetical protein